MFYKKYVLRNLTKFTGKNLWKSFFFNKKRPFLQAQACNFIKKGTLAQVFSCKLCEISENTFSYRTHPVAVSELSEQLNETNVFVLLIILVMFCENGKLPFLTS